MPRNTSVDIRCILVEWSRAGKSLTNSVMEHFERTNSVIGKNRAIRTLHHGSCRFLDTLQNLSNRRS